jgi:hypothetical protein
VWGGGETCQTYHVPLNLFPKSFDVLPGPITERLSEIPPRALPQLTRTLGSASTLAINLTKRALVLALNRLLHIPHTVSDDLARRPVLQPSTKDIPPRGARGHLESEVPRAVDELEHRVRRIVARAMAELVYARVAARALRVARREGVEELGCQGGLEEEARGFFPGWERAFFP